MFEDPPFPSLWAVFMFERNRKHEKTDLPSPTKKYEAKNPARKQRRKTCLMSQKGQVLLLTVSPLGY